MDTTAMTTDSQRPSVRFRMVVQTQSTRAIHSQIFADFFMMFSA